MPLPIVPAPTTVTWLTSIARRSPLLPTRIVG
jgi:hypothetical protein